MSDIKRFTILKSIMAKGFVKKSGSGRGKHDKYIYYNDDKPYPQVLVIISRGSGHKTYSQNLLKLMKKQLSLNTQKQVRDLLLCPMTKQQYEDALRQSGVIDR